MKNLHITSNADRPKGGSDQRKLSESLSQTLESSSHLISLHISGITLFDLPKLILSLSGPLTSLELDNCGDSIELDSNFF